MVFPPWEQRERRNTLYMTRYGMLQKTLLTPAHEKKIQTEWFYGMATRKMSVSHSLFGLPKWRFKVHSVVSRTHLRNKEEE